MGIVKNIAAIAKGMSITFREMFRPTIVENYPDGPGPLRGAVFQERFRGMHVLQRDENGLEKCVACFLCAAACPSNCIYIEAAENTETHRISGAERYAKVYNIDYNRCIFCGYCVEACPTDAITHGHGFELATFNASSLVYRKEQLLAGTPAHIGANAVYQHRRRRTRRSAQAAGSESIVNFSQVLPARLRPCLLLAKRNVPLKGSALITKTTSSTWRGLTPERWAQVGVILQLAILIRTLAEFYRLHHYLGAAEALVRYEPYLGGLLINAVLCLVAVALLFWGKPRASAIATAATILILLAYKLLVIS